jgi:hypothetical protein
MPRLTRAQLAGDVALVVELRLDGRIWRRAQWPIELDGEVLPGGLELEEVRIESAPEATFAEARSVSCRLAAETDWPELLTSALLSWARLRAEISQVAAGLPWAAREVLLEGAVASLRVEPGAPLDVEIVEELDDDAQLVPPAAAVVGGDTWSLPSSGDADAVEEGAVGAVYPYVFGSPGLAEPEDELDAVPAWPISVVDARWPFLSNAGGYVRALVAGHATGFSAVRILNLDRYDPAAAQVWYADGAVLEVAQDDLAAPVTLAPIQSSGSVVDPDYLPWEGGSALYAQALAGVGVVGDASVASAAAIVRWLLLRSSLRLAPLADPPQLAVRFDFWTNDPRPPSLIAVEDVLAWCSASLVPGPDGLELIAWDPSPAAADVAAHVGPDWGCEAIGPLAVADLDQIENALEVRYAPRADTGEYTRRLLIGPAAAVGRPGARAIVDPVAETSSARHGLRWGEPIEVPTVWATATAAAIGRLWIRRRAGPNVTITYLVPQDLQSLRVGSVVRVRDAPRRLDHLAWVRAISRGAGPREVVLQVLSRPEDC